jgi:hypothetical protein
LTVINPWFHASTELSFSCGCMVKHCVFVNVPVAARTSRRLWILFRIFSWSIMLVSEASIAASCKDARSGLQRPDLRLSGHVWHALDLEILASSHTPVYCSFLRYEFTKSKCFLWISYNINFQTLTPCRINSNTESQSQNLLEIVIIESEAREEDMAEIPLGLPVQQQRQHALVPVHGIGRR